MTNLVAFEEFSRMANESKEVKIYNDIELYKIKIGYMLKLERKRKGITQKQMGTALGGWSQSTVSEFENGKNPMLENYFHYANALGVDIAVIFSKARILVLAELEARAEGEEIISA